MTRPPTLYCRNGNPKGGDLTSAKKYLAKADQKAAETINNLGVIALIEGDLEKAKKHFEEAKSRRTYDTGKHQSDGHKKKQNYPAN